MISGRFTSDRATATLLGLPQEELRGQRIDRFAPPEVQKQVHDFWDASHAAAQGGTLYGLGGWNAPATDHAAHPVVLPDLR